MNEYINGKGFFFKIPFKNVAESTLRRTSTVLENEDIRTITKLKGPTCRFDSRRKLYLYFFLLYNIVYCVFRMIQ